MNTILLTILLLVTDPQPGDIMNHQTPIKAGQQWQHESGWIYKVREVRKGDVRFNIKTGYGKMINRGDRLDRFKDELKGSVLIKETPGTWSQGLLASLLESEQ